MPRLTMFTLFYLASFLQAGAYGLTFLLPRLFGQFGANEKTVGLMLFITAISTLITVSCAGHLSDLFGRVRTLGGACLFIAAALAAYGLADGVGVLLIFASIALGAGWGLTYALSPIVLTGLVAVEERVRYFAILSVTIMAGFGLSPVMASMMETAGLTVNDAFFATACFSALAALLFFALTGPVRRHSHASAAGTRSSLTLNRIAAILRSPARLPVVMVCIGACVFAGMNNFQTVFAGERGLDYAVYFLAYTITVVVFRVVLARFKGGRNPYLTIAVLQYVMCAAVLLFLSSGGSLSAYLATAFLFGIGYGVSYPVLAAMAANDAEPELVPQTLQVFALTYFIGIFGFPLAAGWLIVEMGSAALLVLVAVLAGVEATMALVRSVSVRADMAAKAADPRKA
ncbi:MFS transporter [Leisingera sp. ANG-M1]|uniref:MFS transporter n=1 Tax=Leisingera sp. ANG-M1 TaxID=1577895 RepID=UPI00057F6799|nr:MFS transporter [Leisingera sp. ANG-M1]KIC12392.1 MFS transporter [Leisingera sp. ANG-M1]